MVKIAFDPSSLNMACWPTSTKKCQKRPRARAKAKWLVPALQSLPWICPHWISPQWFEVHWVWKLDTQAVDKQGKTKSSEFLRDKELLSLVLGRNPPLTPWPSYQHNFQQLFWIENTRKCTYVNDNKVQSQHRLVQTFDIPSRNNSYRSEEKKLKTNKQI